MRISISSKHSVRVRPVRRKMSFLYGEWCENSTFEKVPETTHTSSFTMTSMSFVHSASLNLVRRPTSILRYEWRGNQLLRKCQRHFILPILRWLMPFVHSASLSLVRRPTSILRYEWRENSSSKKVLETTSTSFFTMILMTPIHFACQEFTSCWTHNRYSSLWVSRELNFSESALDKSYLLFHNDFYVLSAFFKFLDNSIFPKLPDTAEIADYMRISISAVLSVSLRPVQPKTSFLRHEWRENLNLQKVPEANYTSCFTMTLMSFVHSASLSLVSRPTSILRYEWCQNWTFHKLPKTT